MMRPTRDQRGETLLEIVIAIVVMGLVMSGFFAAFQTSSSTSNTHKSLVSADAILRAYAESTKTAVRRDCATSGSFTVSYTPSLAYAGFTVFSTPSLTGRSCPGPTGTLRVKLSVNGPRLPSPKELDIVVRTP
jgi:hypothetical protein